MRLKRLFLLGAIAFSSACVSEADFAAHKADFAAYKVAIRADGDSLEAWAVRAHTNIMWLRQSMITKCPACSPPLPAPAPPPDGDWGM